MMTHITFVVQNETHADNFIPLAAQLLDEGVATTRISVVHLDRATGVPTVHASSEHSVVLDIETPPSGSFYRSSAFERARYLKGAVPTLAAAVADTSVLVIGNDGAMQRVMANVVRRSGGAVLMVLDGLLSPDDPSRWRQVRAVSKRATFRLLEKVGLGHYSPSEVGYMETTRSFAMTEGVAAVLRSRRRGQVVDVVTLPRLERQRDLVLRLRDRTPADDRRRFTYFTSAFLWHGDNVGHHNQERDLDDVAEFARLHPEHRYGVRIHPRESLADYEGRSWPPNVEVTRHPDPLEVDLATSDVVVTARSTAAFEAWLVRVPVLLYERNFGPAVVGSWLHAPVPGVVRAQSLDPTITVRQLIQDELPRSTALPSSHITATILGVLKASG
jgi:hypothetical protein